MKNFKEKVILINPPCDNKYFISKQPPLGILYIASYLREHKIAVSVVDLNIRPKLVNSLKYLINKYETSIVGISSNFSNRFQTMKIATLIKKINKNILILVGGPHPTIEPQQYLKSDIDFVIPFEGEKTMLDFVCSENKDSVPGVFFCNEQNEISIANFNQDNRIRDLDLLPFPAYDLILTDINGYYINTYKRRPLVSMITSRGCPSNCIFCSQAVFGKTWRSRSAENVIEEVIWLKNRMGVREISIEDDNFTFDLNRVNKICDLMLSKSIKIIWQLANGIRVDRISKDLLKTMKRAGCWKIAIAPEVGDEESLKRIKKGARLEQFRKVAQWCKELDIVYYAFFLMGFPFQKKYEMEKIIDFAIELDPLLMDLSKIIPFRGTELFKELSNPENYFDGSISSYYYKSNDVLLERMFKKAYLKFYLRSNKIFQIIKKIGLRQFYRLLRYGINVFLNLKRMRQRTKYE